MHDCSTAHGDAFLRRFLPRILTSPAMAGSLLVVTWDEGVGRLGGGGRVATVVIGPSVKRGFRSATRHSHYSLLRTIQDAWGLGCLNRTCSANDLREFFR
jgi:acid phosphatase